MSPCVLAWQAPAAVRDVAAAGLAEVRGLFC